VSRWQAEKRQRQVTKGDSDRPPAGYGPGRPHSVEGIMAYPMTTKRAALLAEIEDVFASLSPAKRQLALRMILRHSLSVTSGTAEPVAAARPALQIVKAPTKGRA
jgi:hypothetical protein